MDQDSLCQIIEHSNTFRYSSLMYTEPDEISDYNILCDSEDAIVLAGPHEGGLKIHWASNRVEPVIRALEPLLGSIYIDFIPEEFIDHFEKAGFAIHSEFIDFFNTDLAKYSPDDIDLQSIQFLKPDESHAAAALTQESINDSRGFQGDSTEWFEEWLNTEHCYVIVQKEYDSIIGLCCIGFYDFDNVKGPALWVREVVVKASHRGKGYGKSLLRQAIAFGVSKGMKRGFLHCDVENRNAIALYNQFGFFQKQERGQINMIRTW